MHLNAWGPPDSQTPQIMTQALTGPRSSGTLCNHHHSCEAGVLIWERLPEAQVLGRLFWVEWGMGGRWWEEIRGGDVGFCRGRLGFTDRVCAQLHKTLMNSFFPCRSVFLICERLYHHYHSNYLTCSIEQGTL